MKGMEQRNSSIEIYRSPEGNIELNVKLENDTVWLTQSQMAELFGRDRTVISRHVNNCFKEGELDKSLVCAKFAHTKKYGRHDGFEQVVETEYYNLDVIISVDYRVKSINGTRFRQWANSILKQYIIKGYAINQKRLDNYNELKKPHNSCSTHAQQLKDKRTTADVRPHINCCALRDTYCSNNFYCISEQLQLLLSDTYDAFFKRQ